MVGEQRLTTMNINEAIKQQVEIVKGEAAKLDSSKTDSAIMGDVWTLRSLLGTLGDMLVARDDGKTTW